MSIYISTKVLRATSGRRTPRRAADRGALYYGWAYILTLRGKGGHGGSPNVEAGKMYQQHCEIRYIPHRMYNIYIQYNMWHPWLITPHLELYCIQWLPLRYHAPPPTAAQVPGPCPNKFLYKHNKYVVYLFLCSGE